MTAFLTQKCRTNEVGAYESFTCSRGKNQGETRSGSARSSVMTPMSWVGLGSVTAARIHDVESNCPSRLVLH